VGAFVDRLIDELSAVGNSLVMPTLNSKIRDLFGFDFSDMLKEIGGEKSQSGEQTKGRRERQRSTALKVVGQRKRRAGT
jgi:hypothetical protein